MIFNLTSGLKINRNPFTYNMSAKQIIYTDGSCSPNPGPGGWGLYCQYYVDGKIKHIFEGCDGLRKTTNNVMEITGVYEALKMIGKKGTTTIYTDSSYVVNEIGGDIVDGKITGWLVGQRRRGWMGSGDKPIANLELWKEIVEYIEANNLTFSLKWVKGHEGNLGNERADFLANKGRLSLFSPPF